MERAGGNSGISRDLMNKKVKIEVESHFTNKEQAPKMNEGGMELNGVGSSSRKSPKRLRSVTNLPGKAAGNLVRRPAFAQHPKKEWFGIHAPMPRASLLPADTEERRGGSRRPGKEPAAEAKMEKMKSVRVMKAEEGTGLHEGEKVGVGVKFTDNIGAVNGSGYPMMVQPSEGPPIGTTQMGSGSAGFHIPQGLPVMGANHNNIMPRSSSTRHIKLLMGEDLSCAQISNDNLSVLISIDAADDDQDDRRLILKSAMIEMPHVSTKAEGFDRIEGILYKYTRHTKPNELKIVCSCHGYFFSPTDFVKHGGVWNVRQPLKQIGINICPLL